MGGYKKQCSEKCKDWRYNIYIYYKNLPSTEGYTQSRILLKGIVRDEIMQMNKKDIYLGDEAEDVLTYGITIEKLMPVELNDYKKFSLLKLRENYGIDNPPQQGQYFWNENEKLYTDLEASVSNEFDMKKFIEYFNPPCFFREILHPRTDNSFIAKNGCVYHEKHHFIQQFMGRKVKDGILEEIIEKPFNIINLCPVCHRKIHHGTQKEINMMIEKIYTDKKQLFLDNDFSRYYFKGEKNDLEWIKNMYKINNKKEDGKDIV